MKNFVILLMVGVLSAGCSPSTKKKEWTEEVDLDGGRTVTIVRTVEFETSNSWSGDAFGMKDLESTLFIEGQPPAVPTLITNLMPLVLYQDSTNHWVVVAGTFNCDIWRSQGKPRPPYWEYRLVKGAWRAQSLSAESISRRSNLFFRYDAEVPASPITMAVKNAILDHSMVTEKFKGLAPDAKAGC